ncbi:tetratricopeptide repeat-containing sulfotransferase family protein [Rheinheimera maricola]|uniref:Sulfotransferase n=1 Tax=Rheinheimera maricola TaxID=2793282 RepID=A0ABS7XB68_9GAMM|nr:sulfotransferase [Rheinheimera maricola]MBZ9612805.1 sulfotransferase [Rheinheimera maricola]
MTVSDKVKPATATLLQQRQKLLQQFAATPQSAALALQLAQCYVSCGEAEAAFDTFMRFMQLCTHQLSYLAPFCSLLHQQGFAAQAARLYAHYCAKMPDRASLFYNHAYYLRFAGQYQQAITQYQQALRLNITQPEEVLLNIAVIFSDHLRQEELAEQALLQALQLKPDYVPALYNLANLAEQQGDKVRSEALFKRIVELDSHYYQAYARLADVMTFKQPQDPVIHQMLNAVASSKIDADSKINLHFALGKAFDDCQIYSKAAAHYIEANRLNAMTMPAYQPAATEQLMQQIIQTITPGWLKLHQLDSSAAPIFICGMFRSGSTLAEQILAQHSKVTAGGEIEFFHRELHCIYPLQCAGINQSVLMDLAQRYLQYCQQCFGSTEMLTDKRPDNYLYLGLLKALFPRAKFIFTRRNKPDNCLSVYFLRLGSAMNYANRLEHTIHYYQQHDLLMAHWQQMFGSDIYTLDYDQLVVQPETTLQPLLDFLGLEYQPQLLQFHQAKNAVKTASVWQVRQPLYKHASGRSSNYAAVLPELAQLLVEP